MHPVVKLDQVVALVPPYAGALAGAIDKTKIFSYPPLDISYFNLKGRAGHLVSRPDYPCDVRVMDWGVGVTKAVVTAHELNGTAHAFLGINPPEAFRAQHFMLAIIDRMDDAGNLLNGLPLTLDFDCHAPPDFNLTGMLYNADSRGGVDLGMEGGRILPTERGFNITLPHTSAFNAYRSFPAPSPPPDKSTPFWIWIVIGLAVALALVLCIWLLCCLHRRRHGKLSRLLETKDDPRFNDVEKSTSSVTTPNTVAAEVMPHYAPYSEAVDLSSVTELQTIASTVTSPHVSSRHSQVEDLKRVTIPTGQPTLYAPYNESVALPGLHPSPIRLGSPIFLSLPTSPKDLPSAQFMEPPSVSSPPLRSAQSLASPTPLPSLLNEHARATLGQPSASSPPSAPIAPSSQPAPLDAAHGPPPLPFPSFQSSFSPSSPRRNSVASSYDPRFPVPPPPSLSLSLPFVDPSQMVVSPGNFVGGVLHPQVYDISGMRSGVSDPQHIADPPPSMAHAVRYAAGIPDPAVLQAQTLPGVPDPHLILSQSLSLAHVHSPAGPNPLSPRFSAIIDIPEPL